MKKKLYMVLDVETVNDTTDALVYDVGFAICDRTGKIYDMDSMLIADIYLYERELMDTAYYADKLPLYREKLFRKEIRLVSYFEAQKTIKRKLEEWNVESVCAYNASFDRNALNTTLRWETKSRYRWFLPYGTKVDCIWHMACQVICTQKKYQKFCFDNGYTSGSGNVKTDAETVYRYMTRDTEFEEEHTGFRDVEIEVEILAYCLRQKKKMNRGINRFCWKIPQFTKPVPAIR